MVCLHSIGCHSFDDKLCPRNISQHLDALKISNTVWALFFALSKLRRRNFFSWNLYFTTSIQDYESFNQCVISFFLHLKIFEAKNRAKRSLGVYFEIMRKAAEQSSPLSYFGGIYFNPEFFNPKNNPKFFCKPKFSNPNFLIA